MQKEELVWATIVKVKIIVGQDSIVYAAALQPYIFSASKEYYIVLKVSYQLAPNISIHYDEKKFKYQPITSTFLMFEKSK